MQRIKNFRLATLWITAVLLFGIAFAAGADQMMRALPAPSLAKPPDRNAAMAPPPAAQPAAVAPMPQMKLAPPSQGGGMAQLSSAAACISNNAPRISNINGTLSGGILFQPGSQLNIAGCGFGSGGQAFLSTGVGVAVPLIVDTWTDSNIHAHIDAALRGVPDIGVLNVHIKPNGAPEIASAGTSSFHAVHEIAQWALPPALGKYSQVYGAPNMDISPDSKSTVIKRNAVYTDFCPPVTNQEAQMQDIWKIDSGFSKQGFEVVGVDYQNKTSQTETDDSNSQTILVGKNGGAYYLASTKSIVVTFQGNSMYAKKMLGIGDNGYSRCTSGYTVSLKVNGPRGVAPFK